MGDSTSEIISLDSLLAFSLILIFVVGGGYIESRKVQFGNETGLALLFGLIISLLIYYFPLNGQKMDMGISGDIFFYICLPPIIFSKGFNMRRRRFFRNIGYVLLFGIIGTVIIFFCFAGLTFAMVKGGTLKMFYRNIEGEVIQKPIILSLSECFVISAILCSQDMIASVSVIKYDSQPKLYSIVFGEGITNSAISIIIFNTVVKAIDEHNNVNTAIQIFGHFLLLCFGSLAIGIFFGLLASYLLRKMRFLTVQSIRETLFIFGFGYISYTAGELLSLSGIISLLTSGIVMAHYAWYNLSPQGKHVSGVAFSVIGFGFEAFVFSYLGLSFFSYADLKDNAWSWEFILVEFCNVLISRFVGTVGLFYLIKFLGHKNQITFRQVLFIFTSGIIRGAIAFGLLLRLDESIVKNEQNRQLITTSALTLVVSTTLIFGSSMTILQKALVPPQDSDRVEYQEQNNQALDGIEIENVELEKKKLYPIQPLITRHEELIHPNAMKISQYEEDRLSNIQEPLSKAQKDKQIRKKFNSCKSCMKRFDTYLMKPFFIHNYNQVLIEKKEEFLQLFMQEGDIWEKIYMEEKYDTSMVEETKAQRGYKFLKHIETQSILKSALRNVSFRNSYISQNDPLRLSTNGIAHKNDYNSPNFSAQNKGRIQSEGNDKVPIINFSQQIQKSLQVDGNIDIYANEIKKN